MIPYDQLPQLNTTQQGEIVTLREFLWEAWVWSLAVFDGIFIYLFFWTVRWGRDCARIRLNVKEEHRWHAVRSWLALAALVLDVLAGEMLFGRQPMTVFNGVHETISAAFFFLLGATILWWNGDKTPALHKRLVHPWLIILGFATALTGSIRIYNLVKSHPAFSLLP